LKEITVDRMPIICHLCASDIRLRTMFTENEYIFQKTGLNYPSLKRGLTEFWIMHGVVKINICIEIETHGNYRLIHGLFHIALVMSTRP
jgi:hypothetical protein